MNKAITLLFFVFMFFLVIYLNKPSGLDQERIRRENQHKERLDSIQLQYSPTIELNKKLTEKAFKDSLKYVEAKKQANYWQTKYNHEKNNNRHFNNVTIDSLLSKVR